MRIRLRQLPKATTVDQSLRRPPLHAAFASRRRSSTTAMLLRPARVHALLAAHRFRPVVAPPSRRLTSRAMALSRAAAAELQRYTACDVSDALLKLGVPGAGFIADLHRYSPLPGDAAPGDAAPSVAAPVSTVLFVARGEAPTEPASKVPRDAHWADVTEPGTFVVIKQPPGQTNAVCGGIMALRMKVRQVSGIAVAGRVRDLPELRSTSLPIWACGVSTVGAGGGSIPWALQVPLDINGVTVRPGDVAFDDAAAGIVVIPGDKVDQVLELLPKLPAADDKVKQDVLRGMSVHEAFKLHRGA